MGNAKPKLEIAQAGQAAMDRFRAILERATQKNASDVHLKSGLTPIVRVHGSLYFLKESDGSQKKLTKEELQWIAFSLMTKKQKEKFEMGEEVDLGYELPNHRYRINLCQTRNEPRLVCRHIPESIPSIKELHLPRVVRELALSQRGLLLVTGATGSGKSTTLAAMIDEITRERSCHIITIEDPIEFVFKDRKSIVTQREIGLDTKNFNQALRIALRQDPDVILVGEMRDEETISMALAAAETGHLVLSTLHTMDAAETINRILATMPSHNVLQVRRQLASVLVGVISQRLISRPGGGTRIPAVEVLINTHRAQEVISNQDRGKSLREVIRESTHQGMQSFDQSLMYLFSKNLISKEEALAQCSNPRDFQLQLQGVIQTRWPGTLSKNMKTRTAEKTAKKRVKPVKIRLENKNKKD